MLSERQCLPDGGDDHGQVIPSVPAGIDVDLLKRHPARNVEFRLVRGEILFQIAVARLARQGIFAEEVSLLPNPVTDDGIVPIETQGEA